MNKLVIPSILTATVLVASIFALMPIDKASTVHSTIITNAGQSFRVSQAGTLGAVGTSTYTLTCTEACIVEQINAWVTAGIDGGDVVFISQLNDSVDVLDTDLAAPADGALGDLAVGTAPSNQFDVMEIVRSRAPAVTDQATPQALSVAAGGTIVVSIQNSTDTNADAAVTVVFTGRNLGTTTPTAAFVA